MATNINTIKNWFKTGLKPTQAQFWATWDSFWHKDDTIPQTAITNLEATLNAKAETGQLAIKEDKINKGAANGYTPLNETSKVPATHLPIVNNLTTGGANDVASAETVKTLKALLDEKANESQTNIATHAFNHDGSTQIYTIPQFAAIFQIFVNNAHTTKNVDYVTIGDTQINFLGKLEPTDTTIDVYYIESLATATPYYTQTQINGLLIDKFDVPTGASTDYLDGAGRVKPFPTIENNIYIGDKKESYQPSDHDGWIKEDGRPLSALTATQQANATALGFITNLPNATNTYSSMNGEPLGSVTGSNEKILQRSHLPNFKLRTGIHSYSAELSFGQSTAGISNKAIAFTASTTNGVAVTESLNGNAQQPIDTRPQTISVNKFIYLGI